jgi:hypothetical protein
VTAALKDQHVIIEPNSPSRGVLVAFIEVSGAPVELMQIDHVVRLDLWHEQAHGFRGRRYGH